MEEEAPDKAAVEAALERLLEWPELVRSPQLSRFLDYIVRRSLEGDEQSIKAYSIAVDVFGRSADFDPQSDPIVRVQARRLRTLLEDYYRSQGGQDDVRINLPVGRYVPEFTTGGTAEALPVEPSIAPPASRRDLAAVLVWPSLVLAVVALVVASVTFLLWASRQRAWPNTGLQPPSVTVVEFQALESTAPGATPAAGLAVELVTDLAQFGTITTRFGGNPGASEQQFSESDFVLTGIARPELDLVRYSAILTDTRSDQVVWDHIVSVPQSRIGEDGMLDEVSRMFSLFLGSPRGPVHASTRLLLQSGADTSDQASLYLCRMLFDLYRERSSPAVRERVRACFAALPVRDRESAMSLAAMAVLTAETSGRTGESEEEREQRIQHAVEYSAQAVEQAPTTGFAWQQRARVHELQGNFSAALADYSSAIQLNPANGDSIAAYARLLALSGGVQEAEPLARLTLENTPDPPAWYYGVPALSALSEQNFQIALEHAAIYAEADRELGPVLAVMAAQGLEDGTTVNRYLPQILDGSGLRAVGILPRLRERIPDEALVQRIADALIEAGVPPRDLEAPF